MVIAQQLRQMRATGLRALFVHEHHHMGGRHRRTQWLGRAGMHFVVQRRAKRVVLHRQPRLWI